MRQFVFLLLRFSGVPFLLRQLMQGNRVTILCYHDPAPESFERHVGLLKRLYRIISLQEYINARRTNRFDQLPRKALVITFDDGHQGNYRLLPLLREHGIPVTVFLCSAIVGTRRHYWWKDCEDGLSAELLKGLSDDERIARLEESGFDETKEHDKRQSLSHEEVRELGVVVDFQSHSRFHPILPRCRDERAWDEIAGSRSELEKTYGRPINVFAYPNGDYCDRDVELAMKAGYECALTIDGGYNGPKTDMFRLKRMRLDDEAGINELIVKASGLWNLAERFRQRSGSLAVSNRADR